MVVRLILTDLIRFTAALARPERVEISFLLSVDGNPTLHTPKHAVSQR